MKKVSTKATGSHSQKRAEEDLLSKLGSEGSQAYVDLAAMDPLFKIYYLVPHFPQDLAEASSFGWYTPGLHMAAGPLITAAHMPADIREPYTERAAVLLLRLMRRIRLNATPIDFQVLTEGVEQFKRPFVVLMSNEVRMAKELDTFIAASNWPFLHVSSVPEAGHINIENFDVPALMRHCKAVVDAISADAKWSAFSKAAAKEIRIGQERPRIHLSLEMANHNITTPNEIALLAFGFALGKIRPISRALSVGHQDPRKYINRMCKSADAVRKERNHLVQNMLHSILDYRCVLAVQSMYWGHFGKGVDEKASGAGALRKAVKFALKTVVNASTYFDMIESSDMTGVDGEVFKHIQETRAADAISFTAGLSLLAAGSLTPVLRLEPKLNFIRGDLKQLAKCVRKNGRHQLQWKQSRLARNISKRMRSLIAGKFLERIDKIEQGPIEGIKLVSDLPIEMMESGGLPLSMRFDVSRIGVLPGNLYLGHCVLPPKIVSLREISEVLVVRSFGHDDPLRKMLETSIFGAIAPDMKNEVKVTFVDVENEDEFVRALEKFEGAVLIFDGHGAYEGELGVGTIVIGGKEIDVWLLRERCRVPPIVIFSACDTQPIDGSHSSVANAAIALGAHAVLATTLPISGLRSAVFIGRLMYRIAEFVPVALKTRRLLTWREVISGMLRMSYVTEIMMLLKYYRREKYLELDISAVQLRANHTINARDPSWYSEFVRLVAASTNQKEVDVVIDISKWAGMTDSLKYIQIGNPENIVIVEERFEESFKRAVAEAGLEKDTGSIVKFDRALSL